MADYSGQRPPLTVGVGGDTDDQRDTTAQDEVLPSAADSSGLSPEMRQHLQERVNAVGGEHLIADLRARIDEIDTMSLPENHPDHTRAQAERALYVAQISYLEDQLGVRAGSAGHATRSSTVASAGEGYGVDRTDVGTRGNVVRSGGSARARRRSRVYER